MRKLALIMLVALAGCASDFSKTSRSMQAEAAVAAQELNMKYRQENFQEQVAAITKAQHAGKLTSAQAVAKIRDQANLIFGANPNMDAFWAYAVYLADEEDHGRMSHEKRMALLADKRAEIISRIQAQQNAAMAAQAQMASARAAQQQSALSAGMLGLGLMQMGQPRPINPIINCNSIQQGVFTNTTCQ